MSSNATSAPLCYPPFLPETSFPSGGGYVEGRLCASVSGAPGGVQCCLPCPATEWIYPDNFYKLTRIPGFIALASLLLCAFMLISFAVLPPEKTRRQYLNVCLVIGVFIFELGLTVPVLAQPDKCYNAITPNADSSSVVCAFSGAFLIAGGAATNMWTFVRALSMHLMVCWDITPGTRYYYSVQAFAWAASAILLGACLGVTGVSFRFGDYCLVNHDKAFDTFWGPVLGIAAITTALQLSTFGYCLHVYLRSLRAERVRNSGPNPSANGLERRQQARAVAQRVKKVVLLQWRALAIVTIMLVYIIYFCVVFVLLDAQSIKAFANTRVILPWVACLIESGGDKDQCLSLAKPLAVGEATLIASLVLFAVLGIQAAILVGRTGMITGWIELGRAWWKWHHGGGGDIGFSSSGAPSSSGGDGGEDGTTNPKSLEEARHSTISGSRGSMQEPIRLGDKRTYELVRVSDINNGGSRLAAVETGKRASAFGTISSTLSSGNYGSGSDDVGVAVVDEDDDFAADYFKEYSHASFGGLDTSHHAHHKKSNSGGWVRQQPQDIFLRSEDRDSLTALPSAHVLDADRGKGDGKNWPL